MGWRFRGVDEAGARGQIAGSEETVIGNFQFFFDAFGRQRSKNHFPEVLVDAADSLEPVLANDPKHRHVLATAFRAGASTAVAFNLRDFNLESLRPWDIHAVHPADYAITLHAISPTTSLAASLLDAHQSTTRKSPPRAEHHQSKRYSRLPSQSDRHRIDSALSVLPIFSTCTPSASTTLRKSLPAVTPQTSISSRFSAPMTGPFSGRCSGAAVLAANTFSVASPQMPAAPRGRDSRPKHGSSNEKTDCGTVRPASARSGFRHAVSYLMDTFPIVKRDADTKHGHYRTNETIFQIYDALSAAIQSGHLYQTLLHPPPADSASCHPPKVQPKLR